MTFNTDGTIDLYMYVVLFCMSVILLSTRRHNIVMKAMQCPGWSYGVTEGKDLVSGGHGILGESCVSPPSNKAPPDISPIIYSTIIICDFLFCNYIH